jgi:hypothetical protein
MSNGARTDHRLLGLEPDNLLAFLALLGLLRSLEAADRKQPDHLKLRPRAFWGFEPAPLRAWLRVARAVEQAQIAESADKGISLLLSAHNFGGHEDLNYSRTEARDLLGKAAQEAAIGDRDRADLLACLFSDAAIKEEKTGEAAPVDPTPFCLLFGQGHQHFLERFAEVPAQIAPPPRGRGKKAVLISPAECLAEALFEPWHRMDPTFSFRWDPEEDVRYALMAGDPTDVAYKGGTQHGANRLAAVGLAALTVIPETRAGRVRPAVLGGHVGPDGFSFTWPVWKEPATLAGVRSLLGQPDPGFRHPAVDHKVTVKRISVGKFMNFSRGNVETRQ